MSRRAFFRFLPAAAVSAPVIIRDLADDPNATAILNLADGATIRNATFEGVTIRAVGAGSIRVEGSRFNMRDSQQAAMIFNHRTSLMGNRVQPS